MTREGMIPTLLGTAVTGAGLLTTSKADKKETKIIAAGIVGFGLAHVILGGIDLIQGK